MQLIQEYQRILEERIKNYEFPKEPKNLYDPLRYFLRIGGKRTRPSLTLLACHLFGEPGIKALNSALSIELFHNFTLIHDDIMDAAPLRRGYQTVHEKWNTDIAILSGDALFTEAFHILCKNDATILPQLISTLTQASKEVCEGQQMDMDFESSTEVKIEDYIEMIRLKTSVLLGAALKMGAIVAGEKNESNLKNIYEFGVNIGIAFQIQDDVLDLYTTSEQFGKQIGGDILANKKTFLLLKSYELADEKTKQELDFQMTRNNPDKIEKVKELYNRLNSKEFAEREKLFFYDKALKNMENISVSDENKKSLLNLSNALMTREF